MTAASFPFFANQRVADRKLIRPLGSGGEGQVWEAEHPDGHLVAIKLIMPEVLPEPEKVYDRGQWLVRIEDPALVTVTRGGRFTSGDYQGYGFVEMELVEGQSMQSIGPQPDALHQLKGVAMALDKLHAGYWSDGVPLIHRDIKPGNLIKTNSHLVLVDPSTMRTLDNVELTRVGTPAYVAPEVATGNFGPAADVYSFAATAAALLTGKRGTELMGLIFKPQDHGLPSAICRGLAQNPGDRPSTCMQIVTGKITTLQSQLAQTQTMEPHGGYANHDQYHAPTRVDTKIDPRRHDPNWQRGRQQHRGGSQYRGGDPNRGGDQYRGGDPNHGGGQYRGGDPNRGGQYSGGGQSYSYDNQGNQAYQASTRKQPPWSQQGGSYAGTPNQRPTPQGGYAQDQQPYSQQAGGGGYMGGYQAPGVFAQSHASRAVPMPVQVETVHGQDFEGAVRAQEQPASMAPLRVWAPFTMFLLLMLIVVGAISSPSGNLLESPLAIPIIAAIGILHLVVHAFNARPWLGLTLWTYAWGAAYGDTSGTARWKWVMDTASGWFTCSFAVLVMHLIGYQPAIIENIGIAQLTMYLTELKTFIGSAILAAIIFLGGQLIRTAGRSNGLLYWPLATVMLPFTVIGLIPRWILRWE